MFEHRSEPFLSRPQFLRRMANAGLIALSLVRVCLGIGVAGYRAFEHLGWLDSVLEASMILGGEGPIHAPTTPGGKLFASIYALFAGVVFISIAATLIAPVMHRILHRLHLDDQEQ